MVTKMHKMKKHAYWLFYRKNKKEKYRMISVREHILLYQNNELSQLIKNVDKYRKAKLINRDLLLLINF